MVCLGVVWGGGGMVCRGVVWGGMGWREGVWSRVCNRLSGDSGYSDIGKTYPFE